MSKDEQRFHIFPQDEDKPQWVRRTELEYMQRHRDIMEKYDGETQETHLRDSQNLLPSSLTT